MSDLAFFPQAYPRYLPRYLPGVGVTALGEAGDTTAAVLGRCWPSGIIDYTVIARFLAEDLCRHERKRPSCLRRTHPHAAPPGQYCSVLAGVNDLLFRQDGADQMIGNLSRIYTYLRHHNSTPFPITILPYGHSPGFRPGRESVRLAVNAWIRTQPLAIDVERLMGDGGNPPALKASFDGGDGLHPVGYGPRVLAKAVAQTMLDHQHG
jgi:lysophospholipase L1-like esterase